KKNVAQQGTATQSSLLATEKYERAANAIDGRKDNTYYSASCTHTKHELSPWWRLQLNKSYKISTIKITNRGECCAMRLQGAEIHVGDTLNVTKNPKCGTFTSNVAGATETFCCNGMEGRYVTIVIPGRKEYLTLCEVEAFVVPAQCQKFS
uniref:Fucolectin tachylectin-4 pentraxin-1 domain-containing protein n=1 Tax=Latimeria chalumnae TaxID=7897 RepID=H3ARV3_LATCH